MQKYQVFVSSTFEDLRVERDAVVRAVLEMGHIPVGMEMFSAADEEQWKLIARHIDESDYYVVLVAHRYGSLADGGFSFTRKEYEYAVEKGVPVLAFVIDPKADWPADRVDTDQGAVEGLKAFKHRVRHKPIDLWTSADDLHGKCAVALMKAFVSSPRSGWVRASDMAGPGVIVELARLSTENASLRQRIEQVEAETEANYADRLRELAETMRKNQVTFSFRRTPRAEWEECGKFNLLTLFEFVAPSLIAEESKQQLASTLAMTAAGKPPWSFAAINQVSGILADLSALDLVEPSRRKHSLKDENEYWSLTTIGRDLLRSRRAQMLAMMAEFAPSEDEEPF